MVEGIASVGTPPGRSPLVAVLDDDAPFREALANGISTFGCSVAAIASPQELYALLPSVLPACLILDHDLCECNGLEVQAELNRRGLRIPTIFLSGCTDRKVAQAALSAGAVAFLTKPVRLDKLEALIHGVAR